MATYFRLLKYLFRYRFTFLFSIFGYVLFALSQPAMAKLMETIIEAINAKDPAARYTLPLLAIGIFAVRGLGQFIGSYYNAYVGAKIVLDIKSEVFSHLVLLPESFYADATKGTLLHRLNSGVERVRACVTNALKSIISEGLSVLFLLAYVFYLNWQLSLIFLCVTPLLFLVTSYTTKIFRRMSKRNEAALGQAMQVSKELVTNYSTVRVFGAQEYEKNRYDTAISNAFKHQMKIRKVEAIVTPVVQGLAAFAVALIVFALLQPDTLANNTTGELLGYLTNECCADEDCGC